jgi:hypothetical protein
MDTVARTLLASCIMLLYGTAAIGSRRPPVSSQVRNVLSSVTSIRVEGCFPNNTSVSTIDKPDIIRSWIAPLHSLRIKKDPCACKLIAVIFLQSPRGKLKLALSEHNLPIFIEGKKGKWERQGLYYPPKELLTKVKAHLARQKANK